MSTSPSPQLPKVPSAKPAAERRRTPRRAIADQQIVAVTLDGDNGGLVLDLAEDGLAVQAVSPLHKGKTTEMAFVLPDGGAAIRVQGEVRWAEPSGRAGIRLLAFSQGSSADIRAALQKPTPAPKIEEPPKIELSAHVVALLDADLLEQEIAAQRLERDTALGHIAGRIREANGASGTAIALGSREEMICRASAGAAPAVGARLQSDTGLSGECVRSGVLVRSDDTLDDPRVDAEVCRALDLRAAVLVPILDEGKLRGVLEVFANRPRAFTSDHIRRFEQYAKLVARLTHESEVSVQPAPAAPAATEPEVNNPSVAAPVLDTLATDTAAEEASPSSTLAALRSAPLKYGLAVAAVIALAIVGWKLLQNQRPAPPPPLATAAAVPEPLPVPAATPTQPAPEAAVVAASAQHEPVRTTMEVNQVKKVKAATPGERLVTDERLAMRELPAPPAAPAKAVAPPVLAPSADSLPRLAASRVEAVRAGQPASGVVPGRLLHRVNPAYPEIARRAHVGGAVVLNAVIRRDGRVGTVEVVSGNPVLARAAVEAVRQWRYEPFLLNGIPVQAEAAIHLNFHPTQQSRR